MKYRVVLTSQFKRDLRLIERQGKDMSKLERVIDLLASGAMLPKENRDHALKGNLKDLRECHIESDWLLIYMQDGDTCVLTLSRTGTHSVVLRK